MASSSNNTYLRDAILTASQEQLQLMLFDGAIRFASQGKEAISGGRHEEAFEKLTRAQKIVLEMERGLNHEVAPELCMRMAGLYMFCYRKLVDACVQRSVEMVDEALSILRFERETWVMLMEKLSKDVGSAAQSHSSAEPQGEGGLSVEG